MYAADNDLVVPLADVPQSSVGAPCPLVLADEYVAAVAYYLEDTEPGWDGTTVRIVEPKTSVEPVGLVVFRSCTAHFLGPPNDEAFSGHPLASRGLHPYGAFEVRNSSWIRGLERMNSVHLCHRPERYAGLRHFILAFHDSTFECVAPGYETAKLAGPLHAALDRMKSYLVH